jgi:low affinity Fe/Cu permease
MRARVRNPQVRGHGLGVHLFAAACKTGTCNRFTEFRIMFRDTIRHGLTRIGELVTHPVAFGVVAVYAIAWLIFSPTTFGWGAIATLATWMMTLFITRTEHRDTQAIHAKIDELLRAHGEAETGLSRLDQQDVEEIVEHRSERQRQLKPL